MIDRRPAVIVRCLGVADVVAGVRAAREHGLPLTVKGGGHNIAGLAVCEDGLMLDMSLMRGVWVDPAARLARAQAGCLLGDVDRETQLHGLAAVLGFVSNTGCAGLTLGGGFGYLTRRFGWTTDNVASMDPSRPTARSCARQKTRTAIFLGTARRRRQFRCRHQLRIQAAPGRARDHRRRHRVACRRSGTRARPVSLDCADAPPELTCVAGLRIAPPAPWLSPDVHGKPIVAMFVCYSGPLAEGEKLLAPIKAFGSPVGDVVQKRPYVAQQSMLDATQPKGRRYYWKSEYSAASSQGSSSTRSKAPRAWSRRTRRSSSSRSTARRTAFRPITPPSATATRSRF